MRLRDLFHGIDAAVPLEGGDVDVRSLSVDSRAVGPGALFAALPGVHADGARFVAQAVEKGAAAVLATRPVEATPSVPVVVARDARRTFALAAARFHGDPSRAFALFGVTGTNGKTTTTYLIEQLARARGLRAGLIGTVGSRWPGGSLPATHTTPESHELQALLARLAADRVQVAALEVSSHALAQERVAGCHFAGAAFTNLTRDHLDYHGDLETYFAAKARLFRELLPRGAPAVLNLDDPRCAALARELQGRGDRVMGFSAGRTAEGAGAALIADGLTSDLDGLRCELRARAPLQPARVKLRCPLIGAHNAENLLAALALLAAHGEPLEALAEAAGKVSGAPGRLERVADRDPRSGRIVLVDYAHTDDALTRVLGALRTAAGAGPRLICVFGCGGDRDKGKRPLMGAAAGAGADLAIVTSDNPRSEDPLCILGQIEPGLQRAGRTALREGEAVAGAAGYCIIPDRRQAIELAAACARAGDVVLIAGKGHEDVQIVGSTRRHFDDRLEARHALDLHPEASR